ncbi:unnamed protein product [Withania somnifera]
MASFDKKFSLIFLLALLSSLQIHARDGQFFNKVPSNNGEKETPTVMPNKEQEPSFMPENENGAYGLYGHESVSTPSTNNANVNDLPNSKYLPKNYNPVSYVTVAEDNTNENNFNNNNEFATKQTTATTTSNNNKFYTNGPTNYHRSSNNQQQYYRGVSDFSTKNHYNNQQQQFYSGDNNHQQYYNNNDNINNNNDNEEDEYYNAANTYYNNNYQQQGLTETRLSARSYSTNPTNYGNNQEQSYSTNYNNYNTGKTNYRMHQQQGMSDTRFLGNGKFYYDINAERHARDPYENAKEFAAMNQRDNNRNTYGNNEYTNNFENEEFQDEENMP